MTTTPHPNTRTVAIVSQKGGAGKTTLAIHLAAAATRAGQISLVIDTDPQASASQWAEWRQGVPPEIIDSAPPRIASKIEAASEQGAELIVIDTPPHADLAASKAVDCANLVLIPCRPSAFDLAAMRTTIRLVELLAKPAFVIFTAGPPNAPLIYADAKELVAGFGAQTCPVILPDRAAYRHAVAGGHTVFEIDLGGKAAVEIEQLHIWACEQLNISTRELERMSA
ncbi:ParA family partition ATPase [Parerythrobacter aurantius]|uniref:ParA family partition ATPase n=1 Tax=Parerythrobacter aurantius TaxID=3127706 RepID=UPI0032530B3C